MGGKEEAAPSALLRALLPVCPVEGAAVTVLSGLLPCTQKYTENSLLQTREAEANTVYSEMRGQMLLERVICPSTGSLLTARTRAGSSCHWIPSSCRN